MVKLPVPDDCGLQVIFDLPGVSCEGGWQADRESESEGEEMVTRRKVRTLVHYNLLDVKTLDIVTMSLKRQERER